jgi:predicted RNA-binding Zn-ribbon protein involved in translation (DUF1610 family)
MADPPAGRGKIYSILCRCKAHIAVEEGTFGRLQSCPRCRTSFTVAWGRDPKTRAQVPVAVAQARRGSVKGKERAGGGAVELVCSCGFRRRARPEEARRSPRCARCGRWMIVAKQTSGPAPARAPEPIVPSVQMSLVCACGYRRAVRPDQAYKNTRCPGCGKWMIVEKPRQAPRPPAAPRAAPAPSPLAAAARPYRSPTLVGAEAVDCFCGERVLVRSGLLGKEAQCPACGKVLKLEAFKDPQTFVTRIRPSAAQIDQPGPVASLELLARRSGESPGVPGMPEAVCPCGQRLSVSKADREYACPGCGRIVKMQKTRDPQTMALSFKAVFADPRQPDPEPEPEPRPPPPAAASTPTEPGFLEALPESQEAEVADFSAGQPVICQCGEELLVGREDLGRHIQCPGCGVVMQLEEVRDPRTGLTTLRAQAIGKLDEGTWSLADFK